MTHTDTLAQVGYRARRIEPAACEMVATKEDHAQAAQQCLTFLDACAAEAFANRWFPQTPIQKRRRSCVREQILAALAERGPMQALAIMPAIGHQRSATEKALRELLAEGKVIVTGHGKTMGRPRIYGLPEGGNE
jgi:hypothetical protein